jgi:hypothetical protein
VRLLNAVDAATLRDLGITDIESQVYGDPRDRMRGYDETGGGARDSALQGFAASQRHALDGDAVHQAALALIVVERIVPGRAIVPERDRAFLPRKRVWNSGRAACW